MQNIGLFTIKCSVRKFELFLVTIYATDKADVFGNVIVRFQFLGVAEGDGIADILEPVLDTGTNTGLVYHARINCNFWCFFKVFFVGIAHLFGALFMIQIICTMSKYIIFSTFL